MAFGLEIRDTSGNLIVEATTRLTRFAFHTTAAGGASGSQSVSGLVAANAVGFSVAESAAFGDVGHNVTVSDGSVSWAPPATGNNVDSEIYVMQYK